MEVERDKHCRWLMPFLHDGLLRGIYLNKNKSCDISIETSSMLSIIVRLVGVRYMSVDNFLEGNIVDSVFSMDLGDSPKGLIERALKVDRPGDGAHQNFVEKLKKENLQAFKLNTSYGCEIAAICESITVIDQLNGVRALGLTR